MKKVTANCRTLAGATAALAVCLAVAGPAALRARQPVFRTEVRLVQIEVRVTERDGTPARGLTADDFSLIEDDRPQEIASVTFVPDAAREASRGRIDDEDEASAIPRTWVYIAAEVGPTDFARTYEAIRRFLADDLPPGVAVSLGGLPFMSDRARLLAILDLMRDGPYGGDGRPALIDATLVHAEEVAFEREVAEALRKQDTAVDAPLGFGPEKWGDFTSLLSVQRIDRQIALYGQAALFRYLDLIERMAIYPGQKAVVLFRPGLRLDRDNEPLMTRLAGAALRHRVALYSVDARGLDPVVPADDRKVPMAWDVNRRRHSVDIIGKQQFQRETREGLSALAEQTGGAALLNTNNLHAVFETVLARASDYYVLGYYPADPSSSGRFRRIRVRVDRPGVRVSTVRGLYEPAPAASGSEAERAIALRRALEFESRADFPVAASTLFFAGPDGQPVLVFSSGVRPRHLTASSGRRQAEFDTTLLVRVSVPLATALPLYHEQRLTHALPRDRWQRARDGGDEALWLLGSMLAPLAPGNYGLKVVVRDEHSGRLSTHSRRLQVPDFGRPSTPSSLLLTRDVLARDGATAAAASVLAAGPFTFLPQAAHIFERSDTIRLLYHLYNPTPEDLDAAARGMQMALLRDDRPVQGVVASGEPFIDTDAGVIRFTAAIDSSSLAPGDYQVLAILPNYGTREIPHLEGMFTVVER